MSPGSARRACVLLTFAGLAASPLAAQVTDTVPPPPDSIAADTVRADTLAVPPPRFVPMVRLDTTDASRGIWRIDRDEILRSGVFTLADLLSRIPAITAFRTGLAVQPEAVAAFGGAGGRVEVLRDGFPLDPLEGSAYDISRLSLVDIAEIVVERRPDLLRIHLQTDEPTDARPYSRVEAGIAEPEIQTFRGLFLAPRFLIGPLSLGVERVDTDGQGRDEPADAFIGWLRWGIQGENRGVQLELWQNSVNREPDSPWPANLIRQDIIVRARNRFLPGVVAEVYGARSLLESESLGGGAGGDSAGTKLQRSSRQYGVRLLAERAGSWLDGSLRYRSHEYLPQLETTIDAGTELLAGRLAVNAGVTRGSWRDISATTAFRAHASFRPLPFLSVFGEGERGTRGLPVFPDLRPPPEPGEGDEPIEQRASGTMVSDLSALRGGIEIDWRRIRGGGALIDMSVDSVTAFALPFDSAFRALPGGDARAWEAWGRIDLAGFWGGWLYLDGSWQNWFSGTAWPYRPVARGIGSLGLHIVPLASGNLEVRGRAWVDHRGVTTYPTTDAEGATTFTSLPARNTFNADLMIRIMTVRIFARFEDMRGEDVTDIPDRTINGPRLYYGVKWYFWN